MLAALSRVVVTACLAVFAAPPSMSGPLRLDDELSGTSAIGSNFSTVARTYTARDVGFAEGADPSVGGLARRLDEIRAYVPNGQPFIRLDLNWAYLESCRGCALRWDRTDAQVDAAVARGMRVLMVLAYAPAWVNGGHDSDKWFPTEDAAWESITRRTVRHYTGQVFAYEVWNEPNNSTFGDYEGDRKKRYWQLVSLAYRSIRPLCSTCTVLAGGSGTGAVGGDSTANPDESALWLDWAYKNGYGGYFDAIAHHPYPAANSGKGPAESECVNRYWNMFGPPEEDRPCGELAYVRSVMVRHGDSEKRIWGTEWGYPTSGAPVGQPLATVRDFMVQGVRMWRALSYTGPLFLYSYRDACVDRDDMECNFGVVREDFTPKEPLYTDLAAAMSAWPASLTSGQSLYVGEAMRSPDGRYELWLQEDGNLVLYSAAGVVVWESGTRGAVRLHNQADGELILYRADGVVVWSTGTAGVGSSTCWLQNDGNLVLYLDADGTPKWASKGL